MTGNHAGDSTTGDPNHQQKGQAVAPTRRTRLRYKPVAVAAVIALPLLAAAAAAQADPVTGQDHPGDVAVVESQYVPSTVRVKQGESFTFGNYDPRGGIPAHSIVESVPGCTDAPYIGNNEGQGKCRYPRFSTGLVDHGYVHKTYHVEDLAPGKYEFTCQVHPDMHGTLIVEPR
jgi:plastocyanin